MRTINKNEMISRQLANILLDLRAASNYGQRWASQQIFYDGARNSLANALTKNKQQAAFSNYIIHLNKTETPNVYEISFAPLKPGMQGGVAQPIFTNTVAKPQPVRRVSANQKIWEFTHAMALESYKGGKQPVTDVLPPISSSRGVSDYLNPGRIRQIIKQINESADYHVTYRVANNLFHLTVVDMTPDHDASDTAPELTVVRE